MFYRLLYPFAEQQIFFNVFRYITFRTFGALMTALVFYFILASLQIRILKKWQVNQSIRKDGPQSHLIDKVGTPTMGGVLILIFSLLSRS